MPKLATALDLAAAAIFALLFGLTLDSVAYGLAVAGAGA